jgi:pterin-4a-carbinolamine dehydratase
MKKFFTKKNCNFIRMISKLTKEERIENLKKSNLNIKTKFHLGIIWKKKKESKKLFFSKILNKLGRLWD